MARVVRQAVIGGLVGFLANVKSPTVIRGAVRMLEAASGIRTSELRGRIESKDFSLGFATTELSAVSEWYERNGFYGIAGLGGYRSYTGKAVSPLSSLESSAVIACVKIISEDVGTIGFMPYRSSQDGTEIEVAYDDPLYPLLHDLPNSAMSAGEFREALTGQCALGMDGFAKIERSQSTGRPAMIWPLQSSGMQVLRNKYNQIYYRYTENGTAPQEWSQQEVFHLRGFTFDGARGDEIIRRARQIIGLTLATQEYAARFFGNDATPGLILTRPAGVAPLGPEKVEEVKDAWIKWHSGLRKAHEPGILQDGMNAMRVDPDHQKLQLIDSRKFQVVEVARIYRMPLHKLADLDKASFSNIEQQSIDYVTFTLGPWTRRWREAALRCLVSPEDRYWSNGRPKLYADFDPGDLLLGDFAARAASWHSLMLDGVLSIDEVRRFLRLNPLADGKGKGHYVALNLQDITKGASDAIAAAARSDAAKAEAGIPAGRQ